MLVVIESSLILKLESCLLRVLIILLRHNKRELILVLLHTSFIISFWYHQHYLTLNHTNSHKSSLSSFLFLDDKWMTDDKFQDFFVLPNLWKALFYKLFTTTLFVLFPTSTRTWVISTYFVNSFRCCFFCFIIIRYSFSLYNLFSFYILSYF